MTSNITGAISKGNLVPKNALNTLNYIVAYPYRINMDDRISRIDIILSYMIPLFEVNSSPMRHCWKFLQFYKSIDYN